MALHHSSLSLTTLYKAKDRAYQQTHNVNTMLYDVVILQHYKNYVPATLLQRKLQPCVAMCPQRCKITL